MSLKYSSNVGAFGINSNNLSININSSINNNGKNVIAAGTMNSNAPSTWTWKCTDLPQFDALAAQADLFRNHGTSDGKFHLRHLCNDSARCAALTATHTTATLIPGLTRSSSTATAATNSSNNSTTSNSTPAGFHHAHNPHPILLRKIMLDYSRQRVTGETMELLFDLADAVGLTDRMQALRNGTIFNHQQQQRQQQPVLHHVLRMPSNYPLVLHNNSNNNVTDPNHNRTNNVSSILNQPTSVASTNSNNNTTNAIAEAWVTSGAASTSTAAHHVPGSTSRIASNNNDNYNDSPGNNRQYPWRPSLTPTPAAAASAAPPPPPPPPPMEAQSPPQQQQQRAQYPLDKNSPPRFCKGALFRNISTVSQQAPASPLGSSQYGLGSSGNSSSKYAFPGSNSSSGSSSNYHPASAPPFPPASWDHGPTVLRYVHDMRERIRAFCVAVRSGERTSVTGQALTHILVLGMGGSAIGTTTVAEALKSDETAAAASQHRQLQFLTNVDPVALQQAVENLDPAKTLVVVCSKSFATAETLLNARTIRAWLVQHLCTQLTEDEGEEKQGDAAADGRKYDCREQEEDEDDSNNNNNNNASECVISEDDVVNKHMVAITAYPERCATLLGLMDPVHIFTVPSWIVGRFSVTSAMGLLPLALHYSYGVVCDFLDGAHDVDEHFFHAPLRDNLPVVLGLLSVWNTTFLGTPCRAVVPYSHALHVFATQYVQHLDMQSNGKRVALDGTTLLHASAEIVLGGTGTGAQHGWFQLLHQGRVVPADFIGFMESQQPVDLAGEAVSHHDELMSHFFAQPDALAYGKTMVDLMQESVAEPVREHMVQTGNRPSSSLLMTKLDAFAIGQLIALMEHRIAVQGFVWGLNSFDQYATDWSKTLAKHVRSQLSASRKTGASVQGFNQSTGTLLEQYLAHGKQQMPETNNKTGNTFQTSNNQGTLSSSANQYQI